MRCVNTEQINLPLKVPKYLAAEPCYKKVKTDFFSNLKITASEHDRRKYEVASKLILFILRLQITEPRE